MALFLSHMALAGEIESCLEQAQKVPYKIDREKRIESCFRFNKAKVSHQRCFNLAAQANDPKKSLDLAETLSSICFYEISDFKELKSCTQAAATFQIADNHDEAVFDCYRQFQSQITKKQCLELSRQLTYPLKRDYLLQHCQNNP